MEKNEFNENVNDNEITNDELENNINVLQNAINIVKSQRKQTEQETKIIYKRINYLKQKENQLKIHCKNQIEQMNKSIEMKKKRLKYEISLEEKKLKNKKINKKLKSSMASDTSLENLMVKENLCVKVVTLISCIICITTIGVNIIWSLINEKLTLTFSYSKNNGDLEEIVMNYTMIYILLFVIILLNFGLFFCILIGNDHMLTKLIYTDLNWYFILTQLALGFQFLITLIWEIDLWTINVCLSVSMLAILILSFYFTEIKQKKNMSKPTFIFIYIYVSVLFSFIAYLILFNISCILMENIGGENEEDTKTNKTLIIVIKIGINAIQTVLSFVLLTYYKDVFFSFTSGYIESAVFVHLNTKFEKENIVLLVMVCAIALGIILTIVRYRKKTFGCEDIILL